MARSFTCVDCHDSFETQSNNGRLPQRCTDCKWKRTGGTKPDISSINLSTTQTLATVRRPTTASAAHQERAQKALTMRRDRHTWEQIALACGYADRGAAYNAAKLEMSRRQVEINETIDDIRKAELDHLEMLSMKALEVLAKTHLHVSAGAVTMHRGKELLDDGPTMSAIDRLVKISESRRKLLGLDAASKAEVSTQVQFTVQGIPEGEMP